MLRSFNLIMTLMGIMGLILFFTPYSVSAAPQKTMTQKHKKSKKIISTKTSIKKITHHSKAKKKHHAIYRYTECAAADSPQLEAEKNQPAEISANSGDFISSMGFMASVEQRLVGFVRKTISSLHYNTYKFGGTRFDPERGVYIIDCSRYVDQILAAVTPQAYSNLVDSTGSDKPNTQHYYDFFTGLSEDSDRYWNKIENVNELRAGDILVFRYKNSRGNETGGHIMVVMDKAKRQTDSFLVRVTDSASAGHSQDTRLPHTSGVGVGTLLLKADPETGEPSAYAWKIHQYQ